MLHNPSVKRWLGGVEPAWTLLDQPSFAALREPPSPTAGAIRLAVDLTYDEFQQSAMARNTLLLLRAAAAGPGLKMTATGTCPAASSPRCATASHGRASTRLTPFGSTRSSTSRIFCPCTLFVTLLKPARCSVDTKAT